MTREELLELIKKGEAVLLNSEGKDVTRALQNPETTEEGMADKLNPAMIKKLLGVINSENEKAD